MAARLLPAQPVRDHASRDARRVPHAGQSARMSSEQEIDMQWTIPTASDFRFGFEITMYVSAR
jgi:coenzyme PQQ precursor peptide PqqA